MMGARKTFLLRMDDRILELLRQWADDELRSVNGQIEFLLRQALKEHGRLKDPPDQTPGGAQDGAGYL